jgi:transposase InsO family protein
LGAPEVTAYEPPHHRPGLLFLASAGPRRPHAARPHAQKAVTLSVGRTGQCWDNALAESFFATIKGELLDTRPWPSRAAAHRAIFEYIEGWYNLRRLHSALGYRSPADYEHGPPITARVA